MVRDQDHLDLSNALYGFVEVYIGECKDGVIIVISVLPSVNNVA